MVAAGEWQQVMYYDAKAATVLAEYVAGKMAVSGDAAAEQIAETVVA